MTSAMTTARRPPPTWQEILGPRGGLRIAVVVVLIGWLYWDQLVRMQRIWADHLDWSHGYLILPFSLYLIHTRRAELARVESRPSWLGLPVLLVGIAGYVAAIWLKIGYPQPLSMLLVISGVVLMMGGVALFRQLAFPIFYLVLAMPPSDRLYRAITQPLQQIAAAVAGFILSALPGIELYQHGINIEVVSTATGEEIAKFTVAGACSGMRSLLAFLALGLAMAYFTPRPMWQRLAMALLVLPVALFCNALRVVATGLLLIYQWSDLAEGTSHTLLGLGTFALGMFIYSGLLYIMDHLWVEDRESESEPAEAPGVEA